MINSNLLKAELVKNGKNVEWLAKKLGFTPANLYGKLNGSTSMTIEEANIIRTELKLDDVTTREIFFNH